MHTITQQFADHYIPKSGLLIYALKKESPGYNSDSDRFTVESFDIDSQSGQPINFHPLGESEAIDLAKTLYSSKRNKTGWLKAKGILPTNVLHIDPQPETGSVVWYTKAQKVNLFYTDKLTIPNGMAHVPALLWKASKRGMKIYALDSNKRPTIKSKLYAAPFFNTYENGSVCMGSVPVNILNSMSMEDFMSQWWTYFFDSKFAHTISNHAPFKGNVNIIDFWTNQIATGQPFPTSLLKPTKQTFSQFIA